MSKQLCPHCEQEYDSSVGRCPFCSVTLGEPLPQEQAPPKGRARPKVAAPVQEGVPPEHHEEEEATFFEEGQPSFEESTPPPGRPGKRPAVLPPDEERPVSTSQPPRSTLPMPSHSLPPASTDPVAEDFAASTQDMPEGFGQESMDWEDPGQGVQDELEEVETVQGQLLEEDVPEDEQPRARPGPTRTQPGQGRTGTGKLALASLGGVALGSVLCFGVLFATDKVNFSEKPEADRAAEANQAALTALSKVGINAATPAEGIDKLAGERDSARTEAGNAKTEADAAKNEASTAKTEATKAIREAENARNALDSSGIKDSPNAAEGIKKLATERDALRKEALEAWLRLASAGQLKREELDKLPPESKNDPRVIVGTVRENFNTLMRERRGDKKLNAMDPQVKELFKELDKAKTLESIRQRIAILERLEEWDAVQALSKQGKEQYPQAAKEFEDRSNSARIAKGS